MYFLENISEFWQCINMYAIVWSATITWSEQVAFEIKLSYVAGDLQHFFRHMICPFVSTLSKK